MLRILTAVSFLALTTACMQDQPFDLNDTGGGLVSSVAYNADNDTITVDNLAFDGANVYSRDSQVASLGGYAIYEADEVTFDTLTGEPIQQVRNYRTIFGVSDNTTEDGDPRTSFALVRSGGFAGYGFGGFVYERNGGVTIPVRGQAGFSGRYAGVRLFSNRGGLEYTRGDVALAIDFGGDATDINDGGEIVGVFVIESEDTRPEFEGTSVQETGGFILTR